MKTKKNNIFVKFLESVRISTNSDKIYISSTKSNWTYRKNITSLFLGILYEYTTGWRCVYTDDTKTKQMLVASVPLELEELKKLQKYVETKIMILERDKTRIKQ